MIVDTKDINMQVYDIFRELGISPHLLGYEYTSWIICNIINEKLDATDKLTNIYKATGKHFGTSMVAVERCIRHMVGRMFRTTSRITIYKYFGNITSATSGQFIASIIKYIQIHKDK